MNSASFLSRPMVVGTPLKSGTWLIRKILSLATGLPWFEPEITKGMRSNDPANLVLRTDAFYSWHFVPETAIQRLLITHDVRCIFVVRNIFAATLSMYHHFADNIDWEIGRGANQMEFFSRLTEDDGIKRVIKKECEDGFGWQGMGTQFYQMQKMLEFSQEGHALLLTFEELVANKANSIGRIVEFLNLDIDSERIEAICRQTEFQAMKSQAIESGGGSHFRVGLATDYQNTISEANRALIVEQVAEHAPALPNLAVSMNVPFIVDWNNRC